jgi:iron complex transport system substrate-binding protein
MMTRRPRPGAVAVLAALAILAGAGPGPGLGALGQPAERLIDSSRIVTVGGALTETVFALGAGDRLVGADTTSTFPEAALALPRVGYQRALSAEGVLSLRPTVVVATPDAGPPVVLAQLRSAGVAIVTLPGEPSVEAARARIRGVAEMLGRPDQGEALVQGLDRDLERARQGRSAPAPRVLFVMHHGGATPVVSGTGTAAAAMISLAGGVNAVPGYRGYRPLSAESIVVAAPDVIVTTTATLNTLGGAEAMLRLPGIALTPAGRARRIVSLDALYLLGFGPRTGLAVLELSRGLARRTASR